jgi:hypothetical protein
MAETAVLRVTMIFGIVPKVAKWSFAGSHGGDHGGDHRATFST